MPFKNSEEVFEAWKKMSKGRPCDYSGMSYDKLTGGSGIQWPCNEEAPFGTERLFSDKKFFTGLDYCESFGHDLETGAYYSKEEYKALNPDGRAILKACHYFPSPEEPNEEYPLRLSTGRRVHHFHTRTKTGRTPLQKKCPEPEIVINEDDARHLGLKDREEVLVESIRGKVELPVSIGGVEKGNTFIPFHFGYFDVEDGGKARAANELTTAKWDPISKQPMFKGGAIRITKLPSTNGEVKIHAREQQSAAIETAAKKHTKAQGTKTARERGLETWLGELDCAIDRLLDILKGLLPKTDRDPDAQNGIRIMVRIATRVSECIKPMAEKYHEDKNRGQKRADALADLLFQHDDSVDGTYEMLETMQGLHMYLAYIRGSLRGMYPASQALWDKDCISAVTEATGDVAKMEEWCLQQMQFRSPQTLLVPLPLKEGGKR